MLSSRNSNLIYGHAMLFELLCSADHPQVSRFIADPRRLRVEFDARSATPPALRQHIETAQAAAIRFVHDHVERFGPEVLDERVDPLIVMSSLKRSAEMILPNVEAIFEGFENADPFSAARTRNSPDEAHNQLVAGPRQQSVDAPPEPAA